MTAFFTICAVMCLIGMYGKESADYQKNFTYGFIVCIITAVIINIL